MRPTAAAFAVALAIGLSACSGDSGPSTGTPTRTPDSFETAIDRVVPKDYALVEAGTGPYDLSAAAALGTDPGKERAALEQNGFVRAYVRLWRKGDTSIAILGYEFRTEQGAAAYERYSIDDARRSHNATTFDVSHVDGATGLRFVDEVESPAEYLRAITFVRGALRYGVTTGRPGRDPGSSVVAVLAETLEQLALRARSPTSSP